MDIDSLTIGQAKQLAAMVAGQAPACKSTPIAPRKVIVCTDKRAVVFGTTTALSHEAMTLCGARMCLRWSSKVGGVFGLSDKGPFDASKGGDTTVSATTPSVTLTGITAVFEVTEEAIRAWESAPIAGR